MLVVMDLRGPRLFALWLLERILEARASQTPGRVGVSLLANYAGQRCSRARSCWPFHIPACHCIEWLVCWILLASWVALSHCRCGNQGFGGAPRQVIPWAVTNFVFTEYQIMYRIQLGGGFLDETRAQSFFYIKHH